MNKPTFYAAGPVAGSILALIVATAASVSTPARAEYRCPAQFPDERRACELAKRDTPDELRRYTDPSWSYHGLYFYNYVSDADWQRWAAHSDRMARSNAPANGQNAAPKPALAAR